MFFINLVRGEGPWKHEISRDAIVKSLCPYTPPDNSGAIATGRTLFIQALHYNTAPSRLEPCPLRHEPTGTVVTSWARLDNRRELAQALGIPSSTLEEFSDSELILASYLKWDEDCVNHLIGDFVFAVYDEKKDRLFCARDHLGTRPLYYFLAHDRFLCATSLVPLIRPASLPVQLDPRWVTEYLLRLSMSWDRTPYQGIHRLPPAHCLSVTPSGVRIWRYFELSAEPALKLKDSREYVDAYREQLETAVKCRLVSGYDIGSELSGGLDSSSITAYAARFLDQPTRLHTFGFGFLELDSQYIMAVIQGCRLANNHFFFVPADEHEEARQRSFDILGHPVEHINATVHEHFHELSQSLGIRTLLSGFGGDEFSTTINAWLVPLELVVQRRFGELYHRLPGNPLVRLLRLINLERKRLGSNNFTEPAYDQSFSNEYNMNWRHHVVRDDLIIKYGTESLFNDEARFHTGYTDLKRFTLERRWHPFIPTRMEQCSLMAAARKVEYRWPLLDVRLVRLFLSIPSEENFYRGMGRYLHRQAVAGIMPDMVTWKQTKDMGRVIGPDHGDIDHLLNFSLTGLHPAVAEYIDTGKLNLQLKQLASLSRVERLDKKWNLFKRNLRAAGNISDWLKYLEMPVVK